MPHLVIMANGGNRMRILVFVMMWVMSAAAFALPTLDDVEHAVDRGERPTMAPTTVS